VKSLSKSDKLFLRLASITLIFLYLVIIAGSVVRATGSGMGCPDWPKCFGYYIPPTDPSQVEFQPNHDYRKSQMIIVHDTLWRAECDFNSGFGFETARDDKKSGERITLWKKYPVHDYAKFFVAQTWTEYINRLTGATNSFFMLLLFIVAIARFKKDKLSVLLLVAGMCVLAFVIWLGKVVVDTDLKPISITAHMMSALVLVSITIYTMTRVRVNAGVLQKFVIGKKEKILLIIAAVATLDQVIFGTQVRQQIDTINANMSGLSRETWIAQLNGIYLYHKIMAIVVVLLNCTLVYFLLKKKPTGVSRILMFGVLFVLLAEYGAGVFMHNFAIPAFMQPIHLVLAMILFGIQFGLIVRTKTGISVNQ
jgi:cytochrome c oxidase assembly protein subunit 15